MSDLYYGKTGKNDSWGLLANKRIVVWSKATGRFSAYDSISEAGKHFVNPLEDVALFWDNGKWNKVDFFLEGGQEKVFEGFKCD